MPSHPLIELHYLPTLEYVGLLLRHGGVILEACEHFQRRTYRNRTVILSDTGPLPLSLPLVGGNKGSLKQPIREIQLDTTAKGPQKHWRALETYYRKAPFFEHYEPYLAPIFAQPPHHLFDFNHQLLTMCLKLAQIDIELTFSKNFDKKTEPAVIDFRELITPRQSFALRTWYRPVSYYQVFGNDFVPNLSIVDILFNTGPQSHEILSQSIKKETR